MTNAARLLVLTLAVTVTGLPRLAYAQQTKMPTGPFVDGIVMADIDRTENVPGTTVSAGFGAGWLRSSGHSSIRVEVERPMGWHGSVYGGLETSSWALLYGAHFQPTYRLRIAVLVGGGQLSNRYRSLPWTYESLAASFGADFEISVNHHLAVVPGLRWHTYFNITEGPSGSVTRPGVAFRWRF